MANDNGYDPNKNRIKNEELLNSNKDNQEERMARGPQRLPGHGQGWADINNKGREDIKKPRLYHEAMKAKDQPKDNSKQPVKQIDNDKDKN